MGRSQPINAFLTLAAAALALAVPSGAQAATSCAYAGPPANLLTVAVSGDAEAVITRRGTEIVAGEYERPPKPCIGGTPTVTNTDTIDVRYSGLTGFAEVQLANGPLAPGATAETEGASEIEIRISGSGGGFDVVGTPRDDTFRWVPGATAPALNVNPLEAADTDADVTVAGGSSAPLLYASGEGGDDTITGETLAIDDYVYANGGAGDDVLTAPRGMVGAIFYGGAGNDVITGSRLQRRPARRWRARPDPSAARARTTSRAVRAPIASPAAPAATSSRSATRRATA